MAGKRSTGPTVITIALDTTPGSQGAVLTPRTTIEVEGRPPEGLPPVLHLWWSYLTRWEWNNPFMPLFLERLETCKHLRGLCELRLSDNRWQHGLVWALWEFWRDVHPTAIEQNWREEMKREPRKEWQPKRRPGRHPEFPEPRALMAFVSLVRRVLQCENQGRVPYWIYTYEILAKFFPDTLSSSSSPQHVRGRALHYRRKPWRDDASIVAGFVHEAMDIVESCARWGMEQ